MNSTSLAGRLTKDVDLRYTQAGKAVANFNLAVNRPFKNQNGDNEADFINCSIFGKPAENLAQYQGKGSLIGVEGRIQTRSFDNQEGKRIFVTEVMANQVTFLETKKKQSNDQSNNQSSKQSLENAGEPVDLSDELPF